MFSDAHAKNSVRIKPCAVGYRGVQEEKTISNAVEALKTELRGLHTMGWRFRIYCAGINNGKLSGLENDFTNAVGEKTAIVVAAVQHDIANADHSGKRLVAGLCVDNPAQPIEILAVIKFTSGHYQLSGCVLQADYGFVSAAEPKKLGGKGFCKGAHRHIYVSLNIINTLHGDVSVVNADEMLGEIHGKEKISGSYAHGAGGTVTNETAASV